MRRSPATEVGTGRFVQSKSSIPCLIHERETQRLVFLRVIYFPCFIDGRETERLVFHLFSCWEGDSAPGLSPVFLMGGRLKSPLLSVAKIHTMASV